MVLMMNTVPAASAALAEASSPSGCAILWIQAFVRLGNIFRGFPVVRGFIYSIYSVENILQYRAGLSIGRKVLKVMFLGVPPACLGSR